MAQAWRTGERCTTKLRKPRWNTADPLGLARTQVSREHLAGEAVDQLGAVGGRPEGPQGDGSPVERLQPPAGERAGEDPAARRPPPSDGRGGVRFAVDECDVPA